MADFSLPESQTHAFLPRNALSPADPSESILYLAQLDKAMDEIKDPNLQIIAEEEVHFFRMAAAIIANATSGKGSSKEYYDAIKVQFGSGIAGVKKLASALREVEAKKRGDKILNEVIADSKVGSTSVKDLITPGASPFHHGK
jgi:hypothetical protein